MKFLGKLQFFRKLFGRSGDKPPGLNPQVETQLKEAQNLEQNLRFEQALRCYDEVTQRHPHLLRAHLLRGNLLSTMGDQHGALAAYRNALSQNPDYAAAHFNIGDIYYQLRQYDQALACFRLAIEKDHELVDAEVAMACIYEDTGDFSQAIACYRKALTIRPDYTEVLRNLGNLLRRLGRHEEALICIKQCVGIKPDSGALDSLGNLLLELHRPNEAIEVYQRALGLEPNSSIVHGNLGFVLKDCGRFEEAIHHLRRAIELNPNNDQAHSNLLFCLVHNPETSPKELFEEHLQFARQFETPHTANWPKHENTHEPDRRLEIGFISGDFCSHPVATFFESVLEHLVKRNNLTLHAYYNYSVEDQVTQRLRKHFDHWHAIAGMPDMDLAKKIAQDKIDILIDLSGHTGLNRLPCLARKPAPVQASWIGYPGTTGLSAIDYFFADHFYLPHAEFDPQFSEEIIYLPAYAPFLPFEQAPDVNVLPALTNGFLTFGSFNRPIKINARIVGIWSRLLRALPDSRMILGAMQPDPSYLSECFAQHGIARERLEFHPRTDVQSYLELHNQVDLCLDTYPYTGITTALNALWMGVPTLTIAGSTPPGRLTTMALCQLELETFVAKDTENFVETGMAWANNLQNLNNIRRDLRNRINHSILMHPNDIAIGLESVLREIWQRWCKKQASPQAN